MGVRGVAVGAAMPVTCGLTVSLHCFRVAGLLTPMETRTPVTSDAALVQFEQRSDSLPSPEPQRLGWDASSYQPHTITGTPVRGDMLTAGWYVTSQSAT